ncbi:MAG TPA: cytochrome C oxidase subunit IV family protein [Candidatus Angelobacter sp.]|nr:cytochrome C oxidase subunit IV family protein [Candidatus Angelobacter sp.]
MESTMEHAHPSRKLYLLIFFALVVGTCVTYLVAKIDLGIWNPVIALAIACIKAILVILFFMHIRYSSKLTILTVCAGFFWLLIMITLSLTDYLTRL